MFHTDDAIAELRKYFKKLAYVIREDASFTFINTKLVDKKRIDDILCCIEGSFPEEYKKYVKVKGGRRRLKSHTCYVQLLEAIKNRFFFSTNFYSVRFKVIDTLIASILSSLDSDFRYIFSDESGMF